MKTHYRYIYFVELGDRRWSCRRTKSGTVLGEVDYFPFWRQFSFAPEKGMIFSVDCLADIQDFMTQGERREDDILHH